MSYSSATIWLIIALLAIGTFLIRFSFLGPLANAKLPPWALRLLRYTPVAVIPGLVAPMVIWPSATGGTPDSSRILAALAALVLGYTTKNVILSIIGGVATLYGLMYLNGAL